MAVSAETTTGRVEGIETHGLFIFKGIPYAAPPVNGLRWLPPQPKRVWQGIRSATAFGNAAPQAPPEAQALTIDLQADLNEDCLYLNVFTPGADTARRPVFVWIHGGGFTIGAGSQTTYDGITLAKRGNIVVVTINYRLGPFGFLNFKEITGGAIPATGNEGLLDQVAALEWVRDNIEGFGGDPDNVTIAGESAGGMSVGSLLAMPKANGLFKKAILQSGAAHTSIPPEKAERGTEFYLSLLGIVPEDTAALRSASTEKLLSTALNLIPVAVKKRVHLGGMPMQPVADGDILPGMPFEAITNGSADGVSILVGSTLDEWKLFALMDPGLKKMDEAGLVRRCRRLIPGGDVEKIVTTYQKALKQRGEPIQPGNLFTAIQTDRVFRLPALRLADLCRSRGIPAFVYLFDWKSPVANGILGACHALELGFVFGTHADSKFDRFYGSGEAADHLAEKVQDGWIAFIRNADPGCQSLGDWPGYGDKKETMILGKSCRLAHSPHDMERGAWEGVPDADIGSL